MDLIVTLKLSINDFVKTKDGKGYTIKETNNRPDIKDSQITMHVMDDTGNPVNASPITDEDKKKFSELVITKLKLTTLAGGGTSKNRTFKRNKREKTKK